MLNKLFKLTARFREFLTDVCDLNNYSVYLCEGVVTGAEKGNGMT